jgi:hypothetical protein
MTGLDAFSVYVMTALVVNVCGVAFIVDTLLRRDGGSGRIWSLAFLAAMLMTVAYVIWDSLPGAWWAIAVGNAALVATSGLFWLGFRQYNYKSLRWGTIAVVGGTLVAAITVLLGGPDGGDWAGALWMFIGICAFAFMGAIECTQGGIAAQRTAWILCGILVVQFLYFVARIAAFLTVGPDSVEFQAWFGTVNTGILSVVVMIISLVVTSILRAARAPVRGYEQLREAGISADGTLSTSDFALTFGQLCSRAEARGESVGLITVYVGDLDQISTAFGADVARNVTEVWRTGVRRHSPAAALVGVDGESAMSVGVLVTSEDDARRQAGAIYRGLFDDLGTVSGGVIPVIGVGLAVSDTSGYDAGTLIDVGRIAADDASRSVESSVLVGGV